MDNKDDIESLLEQGKQFCEHAEYENALTAFEKVIAIAPATTSAYNGKGFALDQLQRYEESIEAIDRAIELSPDEGKYYYNKALTLLKLGRDTKVLPLIEKFLTYTPSFAHAHYLQGFLLSQQGAFSAALVAYEQAIALDPMEAEYHNGRGNMLRELGYTEEALTEYELAITLDPEFVYGYNGKGWILLQLGRYEEAVRTLQQAITCDPTFPFAWQNMGDALMKLGQIFEADSAYEQAKQLKISGEALPVSYVPLEQKLLALGGTCLVFRQEPDLLRLLQRGEVYHGPVELVAGKPHQCHTNVALLWNENRATLRISTGYALSEDGKWRQHSWLIKNTATSTTLIETTFKRLLYFGYLLTTSEAEEFFAMNSQ